MKQLVKWFGVCLLCVLVLTICLVLKPTQANAATEGDYTYSVTDGKATITGSNSAISGSITIPSTLGGYPVTAIGANAFYNRSALTGVVIPDSVVTIGYRAFYGCGKIAKITLGQSVTTIGEEAFCGCKGFSLSITIPPSLQRIEKNAFNYAVVTTVRITDLAAWLNIDFANSYSCPFDWQYRNGVIFLNGKQLENVVIPDTVTQIKPYAFTACQSIKSLVIPDSVTSIGSLAFLYCEKLTDVTISDSVTSIASSAFDSCKVQKLTIADGTKSVSSAMVMCKDTLQEVVIPDSVTFIEQNAFSQCAKVQYKTYDNGMYLGSTGNAYAALIQPTGTAITAIKLPADTKAVADGAFAGCTSLKTVFYEGTKAQKETLSAGSKNDSFVNAVWHYQVEQTVFANQTCYYCKDCNNYYLANGEKVKATVTFKDASGVVLQSAQYCYGDPVTPPADPFKPADETYTYMFAGWDKEVVNCAENTIYTATYQATYIEYTVRFFSEDGVELSSKKYHWGDSVTVPTAPEKAADNTFTYTFAGWGKEVTACYGSAVYTATYTPVYINYTVTFQNWDGSVLSTGTYHYGDAVNAPQMPTKTADNTYTYTFTGWGKEVTECAGDVVYTAEYTPVYIEYTVTFKNWNGTVLQQGTYHYGDTVTPPENPVRVADKTYTYAFAAWDKELVCTGNNTITATYTATHIDYTVTFQNWDGTVLSTATYHYGQTVTVPQTPVKAADETYTYTFTGWNKTVGLCTADTVYTAVFSRSYINYTITFLREDGSLIENKTYHYGDTILQPMDLSRPADKSCTYTFKQWDRPIAEFCTGNDTYTALYHHNYIDYTVEFRNWDGAVLYSATYHYGDAVTAPESPSKQADHIYKYLFAGWGKEVTICTGHTVYTATFTPVYVDYVVTFRNWDGSVLTTGTYHYGDAVTAPENPSKAADKTYTYTFASWDKELVCTGNMDFTATYTPVYIDYTVTFRNWDGSEISTETYHYGDPVIIPPDPQKPWDEDTYYVFAGWDVPLEEFCEANQTYTATYESRQKIPALSPVEPIIADYNSYMIVVLQRPGYEYRLNDGKWTTNPTFTALNENTAYTVYQRIAATETEYPSVSSAGVTVTTGISKPTSASNYERLWHYVNFCGGTVSFTEGNYTYQLDVVGESVVFKIASTNKPYSGVELATTFALYPKETNLNVNCRATYYSGGSPKDMALVLIKTNRSTYDSNTKLTTKESGPMGLLTASNLSTYATNSMLSLCATIDAYLYKNLDFGLVGLGFNDFEGLGDAVCDIATGRHLGTSELRNQRPAGCLIAGYTGDYYCSHCGEKTSSGRAIAAIGAHRYDGVCDNACNICAEERRAGHTYTGDCDTACDVCQSERTATAEHIFIDGICDVCGKPDQIPGDLDGNELVDEDDVIYLLQYLLMPEDFPVLQMVDYDHNNSVDEDDVIYLLQHLLMPEDFPLT